MTTSFLDTRNTRITKETLTGDCPEFAAEPTAWYAMRAILAECQRIGKPQSYMIDMAQDFSLLHKFPTDRFVYCMRDRGTSIILPTHEGKGGGLSWAKAHMETFGAECHWYTYDISDVRHGDSYNEPQLRPCTAEEAYVYMRDVVLA